MRATIQHHPLRITESFEHGCRVHPGSTVTDYADGRLVPRTFADVADESRRLATALASIGVARGDVVGTLCWNTSHHVAAYFAVPGMGAVLHTLNLRLHPSQLSYIARHSEDRVIIVDADLVPLLQKFLEEVPSVRHVIVVGEANLAMLAHEHKGCPLPPLHEPGRTGRTPRCLGRGRGGRGRRAVLHDRHDDPKGVAYCHRSTYLHTLMISSGSAYGFTDAYTVLPVVPMFHANAWGWVHAAWTAGSNLVMSGRFLQAPHLAAMIEKQRPTMLAAVPTIWSSLSEHAHSEGIDLTCLRVAVSGGSAAIARPGATASRQEQPPAHPGLGHDRDISPAHLLAPAGGSSDERGGRMDDTNRSAHPGVMALSVQVAPA